MKKLFSKLLLFHFFFKSLKYNFICTCFSIIHFVILLYYPPSAAFLVPSNLVAHNRCFCRYQKHIQHCYGQTSGMHALHANNNWPGLGRLSLLVLKDKITNGKPDALPSWNDSLHFCEWQGITCSHRHQRVSVFFNLKL